MFTGIVEELGRVKEIRVARGTTRLMISAEKVLEGMKTGDSICVCGVCLTVIEPGGGHFSTELSKETIRLTTFRRTSVGEPVNLERALATDGRLGGHIVYGHVDGLGQIVSRGERLVITAPKKVLDYITVKGSVAVDGVSLTVAEKTNNTFSAALIPHTMDTTTLGFKKAGASVNLEVDMLARYVRDTGKTGGITNTFLKESGF